MGLSINAAFSKSNPMNSPNSNNGIFSLESEAGPEPSNSPAGRKAVKSPPVAARVSRFRARDSSAAMPTSDTSGPLFLNSSPSLSLQRSLENRLRARMDVNGSPEYALTWKEWDMPAGLPICALRASARRKSANGSTGWPSPQVTNSQGAGEHGEGGDNLQTTVLQTGWPTPRAEDSEQTGAHRGVPDTLNSASKLATSGWASPTTRDHKDTPGMAETGTNPDGSTRSRIDQLPRQAAQAGWTSPTVNDSTGSEYC